MAYHKKVDPLQVEAMLREGKTSSEISKQFGVSKTAILNCKKRLKIATTKVITLERGGEVVKRNMAIMDQLTRANDEMNSLMDLLSRWSKGDKEALEKIKVTQGIKSDDPRALLIKCAKQVQDGVLAYLEVLKTVFSFSEVEDFMNLIIETIGEESPDVQAKIIKRLNDRRLVRGAFNPNKSQTEA